MIDVAFDSSVLTGVNGSADEILINAVDVSERRRYEAQLAHLADHDPLTGLANRRRFDSDLASHLDRCARYGPRGALLVLDLDRFKEVNDTLGHNAGDQLIVSVAEILRTRLRRSDVVSRLGGDEFAVLLPEATRASAEKMGADIVSLIRDKACFLDGTRPRRVTVSVGVVLIEYANITASELMSTADLTMYDAKEAGRDRYALLDTRVDRPRGGTHFAWADRIARALDEDGFVLHAQPVMRLRDEKITGVELLVRMVDDDGQLILPGRFLHIAERLGLVVDIDSWVADRAVSLLERVQRVEPNFHLEVNLSGYSVGDPGFAAHLSQRMSESGADPRGFVFEITETAAVANIETARTFAEDLAEIGCRFALDDFGAGFGSFYYLKHLPFDFVKIDGEFVERCATNATDRLMVASIVGIAQGLGTQTIAESVTDRNTLEVCRDQGVDLVQGDHIGRPVPVEDIFEWVERSAP